MLQLSKLLRNSFLLVGVEQNSTSHLEKLLSALGAFLGIAAVCATSHWYLDQQGALFMVASMGASAVLLFAVPHGALSQPWPVVAGHLVSAFIGIQCVKLFGTPAWSAALAVGLAVAAMHYLRCIHPPGGATALTAVIGGDAVHSLGFELMLFPVAINLAAIMLVAVIFNWPFKWRRYPAHFAYRHRKAAAKLPTHGPALTHEDFAAAMQELNSLIDVTPEDLAELFELATNHAEANAPRPAEIIPGRYYSNGQLGQRWSVRQIVDAADRSGQIIYKTVAGKGEFNSHLCQSEDFRRWASFEVVPSNGHWIRVDSEQTAQRS